MKKLLFMFATAALVLSACSSEDDIVQNGGSLPQLGASGVVGFDVYTSAATKAGEPTGVMTTDKLKTPNKGFGVFAMFEEDNAPYSAAVPDFMYNEQVHWNGGWTYSPLKYWPNETTEDSQVSPAQSTTCDGLSFFAYAPYVSETATLTTKDATTMSLDGGSTYISAYHASETSGISAISSEVYNGDPVVEYKVSSNPDANVDLLWGVAPAGMSYKAVNGTTYGAAPGMPLLNLVKPDKDQRIKFLFEHALSRIGLTVVSAIDQIAAGDDGGKYNTAETRVLIESVKIFGDNIGVQGVLNLNNTTPHVANWIETSVDRHSYAVGSPLFTIDGTNGYLAPDLRYEDLNTEIAANASAFSDYEEGVLPSEKDLLVGGPDPSKKVESATPAYSTGTVLYHKVSNDYVVAKVAPTSDVNVFVADGNNWKQVGKTGANTVMDGSKSYYNVTATQQSAGTSVNDVKYYTKTGDESTGDAVYTYRITGNGTEAIYTTDYVIDEGAALAGSAYTSDTYYTGLLPRYFMVIPSRLSPETATNIKVQISYRVITKDEKLGSNISNVQNVITKSTDIVLKNGKSYNLKLILGMTSVKLDATVADWQVADDTEIWLPKNKE